MQNISTVAELRNAIKFLEEEQAHKGQLLKEQLSVVYESLMPINIIKRTLKRIFGKADLVDNLSGSLFAILSGPILKKVFLGKSGNSFRKLIGTMLQISISKIVSRNSEGIRSFLQSMFQYFFNKRSFNSNNE